VSDTLQLVQSSVARPAEGYFSGFVFSGIELKQRSPGNSSRIGDGGADKSVGAADTSVRATSGATAHRVQLANGEKAA
jgi:hypothetical protein